MPYGGVKWGSTALGTESGTIEWSFADFLFDGADYTFHAMDTNFKAVVAQAFDAWETVADIDFSQVVDAADNAIRIGFADLDGDGGSQLGECTFHSSGPSVAALSIVDADIGIDVDEPWQPSGGDFIVGNSGASFLAVVIHEIGHALGLNHEDGVASIMSTISDPDVKTLTSTDITLIQSIYGPADTGTGLPPVLVAAIADQVTPEDQPWRFQIPAGTFVDPEGKPLVIFAREADRPGVQLPTWLSFDASTQTFSGTPPKDFNGKVDLIVTAAEGNLFVTDTFSLVITPINDAPTAPTLSRGTVSESAAIGTAVGLLSATDVDRDSLTFSLGNDAGGRFALSGNSIVVAKMLDFETARSHTISVTVSDGASEVVQTFKIGVIDAIDVLRGKGTPDTLKGGTGKDKIVGGAGNDRLIGGIGADALFGQTGADRFIYRDARDSTISASGRDTIFDFLSGKGDRVDLRLIDANTDKAGNQAFAFIENDRFHKVAGELRYDQKSSDTYVYADRDGDGKSDFSIHFDDAITFDKSAFLL